MSQFEQKQMKEERSDFEKKNKAVSAELAEMQTKVQVSFFWHLHVKY